MPDSNALAVVVVSILVALCVLPFVISKVHAKRRLHTYGKSIHAKVKKDNDFFIEVEGEHPITNKQVTFKRYKPNGVHQKRYHRGQIVHVLVDPNDPNNYEIQLDIVHSHPHKRIQWWKINSDDKKQGIKKDWWK